MGLSFQPKSENELQAAGLLQPSEYDFEVLVAEPAISKKSGNPMIKIKLGVFRPEGGQAHVYDYLISTMESKLRHFCDSCGLLNKYQAGTLEPEDCVGRSGKVRIVIKQQDNFPPKNEVRDYVCRPAKPITPQPDNNAGVQDDVPF